MTQQKLTGAALLAEVEQNSKMPAGDLALHCGYVRVTRSRKGEERIKPLMEAYYEALLLAQGSPFGLVLPESKKMSSRSDVISYKILKTGGAVIPRRFLRDVLDGYPDDYVFIEEGTLPGTLVVRKDVERSEQAKLEAREMEVADEPGEDEAEDEGEEDTTETDDETSDDESLVAVQQPALPGGVPSTTVRIPQSVS